LISHSLFLFASTLDRSDRVSREIGIAVFGLGFLLPLLGGGNVLFTFEPTEALPFWLVAVFGTAVLLRRNPTRPPIEGADWTTAMLLVFLVWWTVASLLRHSGPRVPMETQALLSGVLLYVGLSTCSIPAAAVEKLVVGLLLGTIGTAIYGQYQYWVAFPTVVPLFRAWGLEAQPFVNANFYNANAYAAFLGALVLLASGLVRDRKLTLLRRTAPWTIPLLVLTMILSRSRSAIALLSVVALVRELWARDNGRGTSAPAGRTMAIVGALTAVLAVLLVKADLTELWTIGWGGRVAIWQASLRMIHDHWALGVGLGCFADWFASYQLTHYYTRYAHSFILEIFAELGIVGGLALVGFLVGSFTAVVTRLRKAMKDPAEQIFLLAATSAAVFVVMHAAVDIDWHAPANVVLLFILLGMMRAGRLDAGDRIP